MRSEIRIEFERRFDRAKRPYLIAKSQLPLQLDLSKTVFFLWINELNEPDSDGGCSMTIALERSKKDHHGSDDVDDWVADTRDGDTRK